MSSIAILLVFVTFLICVVNFVTIRRPENDDVINESVTVIVPMRNEAENVADCIASLREQIGIERLRFIIVNDSSTDSTLELLKRSTSGDSRFHIIDSPALRSGWLGKVSALQAGYEVADSEILVNIDADVRLKPRALVRAINQFKDLSLDFVSPYPKQVAGTFGEKLVQPLLHWSWMSTVILRLVERFPIRSTAIANGQFFVVRKEALDIVDGFTSVSQKILDDIEIARTLVGHGFRGVVTEGSAIAQTRMYSSLSELRNGYSKSLWKAFGGPIGSLIAIAIIFAIGIYPLILALNGYVVGIVTYLLSVFTRELSALRSRSNPLYAFLHPLSSALLIYLIIYSWSKRGKVQWKGRTV
jgi:cellulose synthase/poly-beta-1,6-N-acetylglucosamine synthase-like glycosyltransferase